MDKGERIREIRNKQSEWVEHGRVPKLASPFTTSVGGVSFTPTYPTNLHDLSMNWLESEMTDEPLAAILVRNPANAYDANAIEVHVPALGERAMIGHITKSLAARLAPELDNDVVWHASVAFVKINDDHPDRPGIDITLERK